MFIIMVYLWKENYQVDIKNHNHFFHFILINNFSFVQSPEMIFVVLINAEECLYLDSNCLKFIFSTKWSV